LISEQQHAREQRAPVSRACRYDPLGDFTPVLDVASAGRCSWCILRSGEEREPSFIALAKGNRPSSISARAARHPVAHLRRDVQVGGGHRRSSTSRTRETVQAVSDLVAGQVQLVFSDNGSRHAATSGRGGCGPLCRHTRERSAGAPEVAHHDRVGRGPATRRGCGGRDGAQGNARRGP